MKIFRTAVTVALLLWVANLAGQNPGGTISGVVLSVGGEEPVAGVRVSLVKTTEETTYYIDAPERPGSHSPNLVMSAVTDATGRFTFSKLAPEPYRLVAGMNGYARQEYGREVFPDGGASIVLHLKPTGSIRGTVLGEAGQPVTASLELLRYSYDDSGERGLFPANATSTNDLGEYRFYFVTPGRYYLHVGTIRAGTYVDPFREFVAPQFFPGVDDIAQAATVSIEPGVELSGVDFKVKRQPSFRIRGRVFESDTGRRTVTSLSLAYLEGGMISSSGLDGSTRPSADGTFEFRDVFPGVYAIAIAEPTRALTVVRVESSDADNVVLSMATTSVQGHLRIEGQDTSNISEASLTLKPLVDGAPLPKGSLYFSSKLRSGKADSQGKFSFDNILPMDYRLGIEDLPQGYFLKEAQFGARDLLTQSFRLSSSNATLEVVISSNSGHIDGAVVGDNLQPAPGVQTVLVPDRSRNRAELYKAGRTDRDGRWSFDNIPPGDYKVFAWDGIDPYSWFDPDVVRRYESRAQAVHVGESSKQTLQVRLIRD